MFLRLRPTCPLPLTPSMVTLVRQRGSLPHDGSRSREVERTLLFLLPTHSLHCVGRTCANYIQRRPEASTSFALPPHLTSIAPRIPNSGAGVGGIKNLLRTEDVAPDGRHRDARLSLSWHGTIKIRFPVPGTASSSLYRDTVLLIPGLFDHRDTTPRGFLSFPLGLLSCFGHILHYVEWRSSRGFAHIQI
jgi:hypothetical protein